MSTHHGHDASAQTPDNVKRTKPHEGPRNHYLAFAMSIALTVMAFLAVIYEHVLEPWFLVSFIVLLAVVQAVIQAAYWMHLKDRGHLLQRVFLASGAIVAFTAIIMAIYWVWW